MAQYVSWTVLRKLFYKDRLLLAELARCAAATILELYKAIFPEYHSRPGIISSINNYGTSDKSKKRWHFGNSGITELSAAALNR